MFKFISKLFMIPVCTIIALWVLIAMLGALAFTLLMLLFLLPLFLLAAPFLWFKVKDKAQDMTDEVMKQATVELHGAKFDHDAKHKTTTKESGNA